MEANMHLQAVTLQGVKMDVITAGNVHNVLHMARMYMSSVLADATKRSVKDFAASALHCAIDYHFFGAERYKLPSYAWIPIDLQVEMRADGLSNNDLFEVILEYLREHTDIVLNDDEGNAQRVAVDGILHDFHIHTRDELCEWLISVYKRRNDDLGALAAPQDGDESDFGGIMSSVMGILGGMTADGDAPSFADMMRAAKAPPSKAVQTAAADASAAVSE